MGQITQRAVCRAGEFSDEVFDLANDRAVRVVDPQKTHNRVVAGFLPEGVHPLKLPEARQAQHLLFVNVSQYRFVDIG